MATIKDVAKAAGVSVATVSRVINKSPNASEASIEAVTLAMKQLGYRPNATARALVSQSTNTVGVLVSDVSDPFFGTLIKTVDDIARQNGKHTLIGNGYHNAEEERQAIELLMNSRCDAFVIHAKALSDQELIDYTQEMPTMVLINRYIPELADRCIAFDNFRGTYLATDYLIRLGHRHIAYISSTHSIEDTNQRLQGYQAALHAHKMSLEQAYVEYGEPTAEGGELAMTCLLSKSLPITAVVAYNDFMAAGAISILDENNIHVPDEISVVGLDDSLIARYIHPRLTTIRYPIQLMAEQAAQLTIALSRGEHIGTKPTIYTPTLVQRKSAGKVR